MVAIEVTKASKVDAELGGEKLTIEVAKAPAVKGKKLPSIKDAEKEVPIADFKEVVSNKVFACYSQASQFLGLTDPLQVLRRYEGFHAFISPTPCC